MPSVAASRSAREACSGDGRAVDRMRRARMSEHLPLIVIEVLLVFGGAVAFAWWQFRDLARERRKREEARKRGDSGKAP
jgi:hypothetical protein